MPWYSVHVEARSPDGAGLVDDAALNRFATELEQYHGIVGGIGDRWDARISVKAATIEIAEHDAGVLIGAAVVAAELPRYWPVVVWESIREDVLAERLATPSLPDLVSGPEAAEILGVSNQRLHQLAVTHPDFPEPVYKLRAASVWLKAAVVKFNAEWERKPGRPRKTDDAERR